MKDLFSSSFCYSLDDDPFHFHCPWKNSLFLYLEQNSTLAVIHVLRESLMTWSFIFITSRNNLWRQFIRVSRYVADHSYIFKRSFCLWLDCIQKIYFLGGIKCILT